MSRTSDARGGGGIPHTWTPLWLRLVPLALVPLAYTSSSRVVTGALVGILVLSMALRVWSRETVRVTSDGVVATRLFREARVLGWDEVERVSWVPDPELRIVARLIDGRLFTLVVVRRGLRRRPTDEVIDGLMDDIAVRAPAAREKLVTVKSQRRSTESLAATLFARGADKVGQPGGPTPVE